MNSFDFIHRIPESLWTSAKLGAEALADAQSIAISAHIDADGISSAAIARAASERLGKTIEVEFFKKLDDAAIRSLRDKEKDIVWFTDLGSGSLSKIEGIRAVVTDHHVPDATARTSDGSGQKLLTDFSTVLQVNPQVHGLSGAQELSGAGSTFLVAVAMDAVNIDLAYLAILGAVGDLQDQKTKRLEGLNRTILELAEGNRQVRSSTDITYFGRETRPVHKLLEFSSDPFLPRISGNEQGALGFLLELGIELKEGDSWRTWSDLSEREKSTIITSLQDHLASYKRRPEVISRLVGEVYVLEKERKGSPLRDAKEYATLLNACGRHGKARIGLEICVGNRDKNLSEGMDLLRNHRSAISRALNWARGSGIVRLRNIQFFDAGDEIEDTIVGTVAGMLLGSEGADRTVPMIAFAESTEYSDEPKSKASGRGTQELVARGMDLSIAIRTAAEQVGGVGGGHSIAAGATIPAGKKKEFLDFLDDLVGVQLSRKAQR